MGIIMRLLRLLLFVAMLPAQQAAPLPPRRRRRGGSNPARVISVNNPFFADLQSPNRATAPVALGSTWVHRGGSSAPNQSEGSTPLTARALAPDTRPVPDTDQRGSVLRRQYNLTTSPLSLTVSQSSSSILYAAPLNPLLPLQDGTNSHIMATEASNYAQYRVQRATIRFRPLVPNSVGGYVISVSFWPQTTTTPTSVDMNSITATDVRVIGQPGIALELVIPSERLHYRSQGWRSVETESVPEEEATSGLVMLCIHGTPINSFTNSPYTGALGMLDFALTLEFRNLTPGNTNLRVTRVRSTAPHRLTRGPKGQAQITTAAASRFMQDLGFTGENSLGDVGRGIVMTLFNLADTVLGGLPTALLSAAGGQMFYGRPVNAGNGEPTLRLYTSVEDAQQDNGIILAHDIDLGTSSVTVQDYNNQHPGDRPAPPPAPPRPLMSLQAGDVLWVTMQAAQYKQSPTPETSSPVYVSSNAVVINAATGQRANVASGNWQAARLDGQLLPQVTVGSDSWWIIPLAGKVSFWKDGTREAGYPYNYNNTSPGAFYISMAAPHQILISTYTTMLGTGPITIKAVGVVSHHTHNSAQHEFGDLGSHTLRDPCPECDRLGLPPCSLMEAITTASEALSVHSDV